MRLGIDPGVTGALALLNGDQALWVADMPSVADGRKQAVCAPLLADMLRGAIEEAGETPSVILERVAARPGQGVTSMFNFGRSAGIVEGVCGALGLRIVRSTPQTWKKRAKLLGKPKDASRGLAIDLFPEVAHLLQRKRDGNRADALLIAFFGGLNE